jgi:hypothetical protein
MLELVFFGVEVLLAAGFARDVLEQLKGGTVDAIASAERRRQRGPRHEGGPPAGL